MQDTALIAHVPLFAALKPIHRHEIAGKLGIRNYQRGATIFQKDDIGSTLYVIRTGLVKIATQSPAGNEALLAILTDGDFFGELSILDGKPRCASATAMEATGTYTLDRSDLLEIIARQPDVGIGMIACLCERLRSTHDLLEDAVFLDLPARLAKRLLDLADKHGVETDRGLTIDMRLTQYDLANAIGASRESVNRLLGTFQDERLVSMGQHRIHILRLDHLRKYVR